MLMLRQGGYMTPSSLAAAARRLGGHYRVNGMHIYYDDGVEAGPLTNADLCMALLETMPACSLGSPRPGEWDCIARGLHRYYGGPTPLDAVLACCEAMEGE
jgi:hypothetical protein